MTKIANLTDRQLLAQRRGSVADLRRERDATIRQLIVQEISEIDDVLAGRNVVIVSPVRTVR